MAGQVNKRKDKDRIVLRKGESQRKDGNYDYRWTTRDGKRHSVYAKTLEELRAKEEEILRDKCDGIKTEARYVTINDVFEVWKQLKRGLKDNTFQNYKYMYEQFVKPDFGNTAPKGKLIFQPAILRICSFFSHFLSNFFSYPH